MFAVEFRTLALPAFGRAGSVKEHQTLDLCGLLGFDVLLALPR
jgi:hypothetical protein